MPDFATPAALHQPAWNLLVIDTLPERQERIEMPEPKRVNVYLWVWDNAPENPLFPAGNPLSLFPVSRQVDAAAPARPSLELSLIHI